MELRLLRYFVVVADQLSFTRAAALLHMAQPALSVQIRQLEDELGVELFDRSRRAIALTHAGETMLGETRRLLASLDRSVDLVRRVGAGAIGSIAVGFVPSASNSVLPGLLRRFWEAHPDVAVTLREMAPGDLVDGLHAGNLDISFLYLPFSDPLLDHLVIVREPFVAALPFDHPLAREPTVDVADLRDEPFVTPADHGMMPGLHAKVSAICHAAGFVRAIQFAGASSRRRRLPTAAPRINARSRTGRGLAPHRPVAGARLVPRGDAVWPERFAHAPAKLEPTTDAHRELIDPLGGTERARRALGRHRATPTQNSTSAPPATNPTILERIVPLGNARRAHHPWRSGL
jgi:DNA-binding transcriptional LysR family regulator